VKHTTKPTYRYALQCECSDPGCPIAGKHKDSAECGQPATMRLRRIDMEDGLTAFDFCDECGSDALESGVFADDRGSE
jgi:hypothetical protein